MHPDDEAAFRAFVHARSGALLRAARLLTGDLTGSSGAAEDLLQDALSRLAPRWASVHNPEAYTRTAMHRLQISRWRRRSVREVPLDAVPARIPDAFAGPTADASAAVHDRMLLQQALLRLTARQRSVLVCRYLEDLDERQTAQRLGIRVGSVRSIGARSLARLRQLAPELDQQAMTEATR